MWNGFLWHLNLNVMAKKRFAPSLTHLTPSTLVKSPTYHLTPIIVPPSSNLMHLKCFLLIFIVVLLSLDVYLRRHLSRIHPTFIPLCDLRFSWHTFACTQVVIQVTLGQSGLSMELRMVTSGLITSEYHVTKCWWSTWRLVLIKT